MIKPTYFETLALSCDCVDEVGCDANIGFSGPLRTPDVGGSGHMPGGEESLLDLQVHLIVHRADLALQCPARRK